MSRIAALFTLILLPTPAFAHLGHVGEVAGHAHWVGLGAIVVAGALAAAIGKLKDKTKDDADTPDAEEETGEEVTAEG